MKTPVNALKVALCCLGLLCIAGSSNHYFKLAFYHSQLQSRITTQSYFQFPGRYLSHLNDVNDDSLFELVTLGVHDATFHWSLRLLEKDYVKRAKRYWESTVVTQKPPQRLQLAEQLLRLKQWADLADLAKQSLIPESTELETVKLHLGVFPTKIDPEFADQFSFLLNAQQAKASSTCRFNVLLMSDHLQGLEVLNVYKTRYQQQPEPSEGSFCLSTPVYLGKQISCNNNPEQRANCHWRPFIENTTLAKGFDFIVMMPRVGTASVQSGIMHLSSKSHYGVFLHELMHFNGFEDEYPLTRSKQQWLCQLTGRVAPNLFISQGKPPPKGWQLSKACEQGGKAYKPTKRFSIMQYQQIPLSVKYRQLWQQQVDDFSVKPLRYSDLFRRFSKTRTSINNMTNNNISE